MSYDVYGNVGLLNGLADSQQQFHNRFRGIMSGIDAVARATLGQWEGAGQAGFTQTAADYERVHTEVLAAFSRLIVSTQESSDSYGRLTRQLQDLFD